MADDDRQKATGTVEQDRVSALVGVEGMRVVEVEVEDDGGLTVWVATDDPSAVVCPECGVSAERG